MDALNQTGLAAAHAAAATWGDIAFDRADAIVRAYVEALSREIEADHAIIGMDYFGGLVVRARAAASKASIKFPQPNYVALKIAEEAGEVVRGAVHYAEDRMAWSEVEGEIVQLLAMLIRFVTEGDHINGIHPPAYTAVRPLFAPTPWSPGHPRLVPGSVWRFRCESVIELLEHLVSTGEEPNDEELSMIASFKKALALRSSDAGEVKTGGVAAIAAERLRQIEAEGWSAEHDDEHSRGQMATAAACYVIHQSHLGSELESFWPWEMSWWKPSDRRRDLVKAGALIAAEIDRLDRGLVAEAIHG